ncbi:restriction endonuclease subunit S [Thiorhodococcus fuscus]|uniref:Restriction endonuclease subunit S n=1 Tax=Thiorhodococcus fuscus TaxID=527200 RepID=A0ABW4Y5U3_9GAMM
MNPDRLLALYERIADAPDAVARLRRFILDLAVRGRLVPQDPHDKPAIEHLRFLSGIPAKTKHLIKPLCDLSVELQLPLAWSWLPLGALITRMDAGWSPQCEPHPRTSEEDWGVLRTTSVQALAFNPAQHKKLPEKLKPRPEYQASIGDILVTRAGPKNRVGVSCVVDVVCPRLMISDKLIRFHALGDLSPRFLALALNAGHTFEQIEAAKSGMAVMQMNISQSKLRAIPIPLPPIAEQHRIVAKVDELMALCDRLEAARAQRESARDRLAAASLARLNAPDLDLATFTDHARFVLDALPALTTRADQIKQLRQTILNLAVRGKLVPQDLSDEPASELLCRIRSEKTRLLEAGEISKGKHLKPIASAEQFFEPPSGWVWCRCGELVLTSDSGWSPRTESHARQGDAWGVLKVSAVSWDRFDPAANKQVLPGTKPRLQAQVHKGDFLISRANTAELIARSVLVLEEPLNLMMSDKIVRLRLTSHCSHRFLWVVNNHADFARAYYAANATGVSPSMKNVARGVILDLPIPLPPLAEQHRIVAKVDELMALCDRLEASLATADSSRRRLLDALLHEALAPAMMDDSIESAEALARQDLSALA